jgi:ABC-2 type transport system permease protein
MNGLLAAKWLHVTLLGAAQITVMFLWGWAVFQLDLFGHLPGFAIMTALTASAAAGFGLVLATLCRTRQQLGGMATLIILIMSALGGSMFPRFLMSAEMQNVGLITFNAWALDGYLKVFWRDLPIASLAPQVGVLAALTLVFLATARWLARRWEAV